LTGELTQQIFLAHAPLLVADCLAGRIVLAADPRYLLLLIDECIPFIQPGVGYCVHRLTCIAKYAIHSYSLERATAYEMGKPSREC
jgi:hypothetical protein